MDEQMEDAPPPVEDALPPRLPYELHCMILQKLTHIELKSKDKSKDKSKPKPKILSNYAVVCKSWQAQIEEANFKNLAIVHTDVPNLAKILQGPRRTYLKHLSVTIKLEKYPVKKRFVFEDDYDMEANSIRFTQGIFDLFEVLAKWDTPDFWEARHGRGINLELRALSPSDKKAFHGTAGLDHEGNNRYFDSMLDFDVLALDDPQGIHGLPLVNAVTGFHILRKNYRNIAAAAITPIVRSLPRLDVMRLEPWQQVDPETQRDRDADLAGQIPFWPTHLRRVSLFTHFGAFDQWMLHGMPPGEIVPRPDAYRFLSHGIRRLSLNLEELSASFMVDAEHFFEPFINVSPRRPGPVLQWPNLRWLTLTSGVIASQSDPDDINKLLHGAGLAALQMPQLQAMELWNATTWHGAGAFRYLIVDKNPLISWTSTFDFKLGRDVKAVWRQVALQHTRQKLYVSDEVVLPDYKGGAEGFIHEHLATRALLLHQVSSEDMMETQSFPPPVLKLRETTPEEP